MERLVGLLPSYCENSIRGIHFFKQALFFKSFLCNFVFVAFSFLSWVTELFVNSAP